MIEAEARIAGTPLTFALETPRTAVLAASNALVKRLALLALALTVAGAALAWGIGRRVAKPIVVLTDAAESVARGDYATRVPSGGPEEVARLAASFNEMSGRIGEALSQIEQREAEFRALADAIPQLAWMADANGHVFWYNHRWYEYTGTTADEMANGGWAAVHDPASLPLVERKWRDAVQHGQRLEIEHTLRRADGTPRWFLTRVEPLVGRDGKVVRWFGTNTDIQTLREARESAQTASRAKSDFLATMSHELRTPLNAIGGYVELLDLELRGPVTDAQRRDFVRIRTNQQHLLGLISSVLDLSRIESGRVKYELEPIGVDAMLAGLDALVGPQAASKQLSLEYMPAPPDLVVTADGEKLRQILLNLLSNAIRNTPSGGRISMQASGVETAIDISVRDSGPGIPLDKQEAIFEPFVQLDRSLTQLREGVGLGLSISRDLARGMGGSLTVVSTPGEGACFTVSLPRGADEILDARLTGERPAGQPRAAEAT
jgi:PAS domain S-box-containing protein